MGPTCNGAAKRRSTDWPRAQGLLTSAQHQAARVPNSGPRIRHPGGNHLSQPNTPRAVPGGTHARCREFVHPMHPVRIQCSQGSLDRLSSRLWEPDISVSGRIGLHVTRPPACGVAWHCLGVCCLGDTMYARHQQVISLSLCEFPSSFSRSNPKPGRVLALILSVVHACRICGAGVMAKQGQGKIASHCPSAPLPLCPSLHCPTMKKKTLQAACHATKPPLWELCGRCLGCWAWAGGWLAQHGSAVPPLSCPSLHHPTNHSHHPTNP